MPYITPEVREILDETLKGVGPGKPGELTYVLYRICLRYLTPSPNFTDIAEVLGALEATKLELYRRKVAPYEDKKIEQNGDVC